MRHYLPSALYAHHAKTTIAPIIEFAASTLRAVLLKLVNYSATNDESVSMALVTICTRKKGKSSVQQRKDAVAHSAIGSFRFSPWFLHVRHHNKSIKYAYIRTRQMFRPVKRSKSLRQENYSKGLVTNEVIVEIKFV